MNWQPHFVSEICRRHAWRQLANRIDASGGSDIAAKSALELGSKIFLWHSETIRPDLLFPSLGQHCRTGPFFQRMNRIHAEVSKPFDRAARPANLYPLDLGRRS